MARYNDGRSALSHDIAIEAHADGLTVLAPGGRALWPWAQIARADEGGGEAILKRVPDEGERLTLEPREADAAIDFAPQLFTARALRRESPRLVPGLLGVAAALAAVFLVGVPLAATPLARFVPARYQAHLGQVGWAQVRRLTHQCEGAHDSAGWAGLEDMFNRLKAHAHDAKDTQLFVVDANFANAFTLPDGSIVLTNKMIDMAEAPDELAGVMAHELGHVEAHHVMASVVRQMGVGMFVDVVFGGAGAGEAVAAVNVLALRFSRHDEAEADAIGLRLMDQAGMNPGATAALFRRVAAHEQQNTALHIPELISSHPDSGRRAQEAAAHARPGRPPALDAVRWKELRAMCPSDAAPRADDKAAPTPKQAPAKPAPDVDEKPLAKP